MQSGLSNYLPDIKVLFETISFLFKSIKRVYTEKHYFIDYSDYLIIYETSSFFNLLELDFLTQIYS